MLIAELRGSIVTIRAEKLSVSYLDQIQESKKETNKTQNKNKAIKNKTMGKEKTR